jgi:hypothetical protein
MFVERLIGTSSLVELHFKNSLLQNPHDWVLLVKKMHPSMLENFHLGGSSFEQYISISDAVDLKFTRAR